MNITNSGMINDDGSAATGINSSDKVINRIPKDNYTGDEIVGDDADKDMILNNGKKNYGDLIHVNIIGRIVNTVMCMVTVCMKPVYLIWMRIHQ